MRLKCETCGVVGDLIPRHEPGDGQWSFSRDLRDVVRHRPLRIFDGQVFKMLIDPPCDSYDVTRIEDE